MKRLFGDNLEFAFFGALASVGALFVFEFIYQYGRKMSNNIQIKRQDVENIINDETFEFWRRVFSDAADLEIRRLEEESKDMEIPPPSKRQKKRMNRLFRERVGGAFLPFPEEDNLYERIRSKLVIKFKINEILNRHEKQMRDK